MSEQFQLQNPVILGKPSEKPCFFLLQTVSVNLFRKIAKFKISSPKEFQNVKEFKSILCTTFAILWMLCCHGNGLYGKTRKYVGILTGKITRQEN